MYTFYFPTIEKEQITIYDNKGKTWDRYTVIIDTDVYGMSENATQPNGFNMWSCTTDELRPDREFFGKKVQFKDLPDEVQKAISNRLEAYE